MYLRPIKQPLKIGSLCNAKIVAKKKTSQAFSFSRRKTTNEKSVQNKLNLQNA